MSNEMKFEEKYKNLKAKFLDSVDLAFRLGFEQGQQQSQMDQMAQQQQQAEMAAAQSAQQGQPGQPGQSQPDESQAASDAPAQEQNPMGSELDQHINELEGLMGKSEELSSGDLRKAIGAMASGLKSARDLRKSHEAIKGISLAMHTPAFKVSQQAKHNLDSSSKQSLAIQNKIVADVFKSWDEEEREAQKGIAETLLIEGLIKK